tara:strand:- start:524 stop:1195 length:672 start_codon:yes stop_codon:yes gene_type:complete
MQDNIVIFGGSSEIAIELNNILSSKNHKNFTISRRNSSHKDSDSLIVNNYLEDYAKIKREIEKLSNVIVVFFNGHLSENRDQYSPNLKEIIKTDEINFTIPYYLSLNLNNDLSNIKKFVYISSMAAVKPRYKNYIYGLSKRKLEEGIKYLDLPSYLIIRYGKVITKMSEDHKNPPFTLTVNDAANYLYKNINKTGIQYPKLGLKILSIVIKLLPGRIIKKIGL